MPRSSDSLERLIGQHIVILMATINKEKRLLLTSSKGQGIWGEVWGTQGGSFQESSPSGFTKDALNATQQWIMTICVQCCQLGILTRASVPKVFIRGCSYSYPLYGMCSNSRLPEGNEIFSINQRLVQIVWAQRATLRQCCELPEIKFSDSSQGTPCKQAFQRIAVRYPMLTIFQNFLEFSRISCGEWYHHQFY